MFGGCVGSRIRSNALGQFAKSAAKPKPYGAKDALHVRVRCIFPCFYSFVDNKPKGLKLLLNSEFIIA